MAIFKQDQDFAVFLNLLKRYLDGEPSTDNHGQIYPHLHGDVELLTYCLMPNHFHLLVYQQKQGSLHKLMRGQMTSYGMYFNKTYDRTGPIFEGRYRASKINSQTYVEHISRYIHLNPKDWQTYQFSSLPYFRGMQNAAWILPAKIINMFGGFEQYEDFLADYEDYKQELDEVKSQIAEL